MPPQCSKGLRNALTIEGVDLQCKLSFRPRQTRSSTSTLVLATSLEQKNFFLDYLVEKEIDNCCSPIYPSDVLNVISTIALFVQSNGKIIETSRFHTYTLLVCKHFHLAN